jgi:peptide/nickel transport system substrate-binding protein
LRKGIFGFLSVCVIILCATVLSVPISGIMGIINNTAAAADEPLRLKIGFMQSIDSLNPYVGLNDASYIFYGLVYDALDVIDNDMKATPDLVKGGDDLTKGVWAVPENYDADPKLVGMPYGSVWQYNLTENATWTDGEPFTADDVLYNVWLNAEPSHYDSMWAYQPYSYYMHEAWAIDEWTVRVSFWDRATLDPIPAAYAYLLSIPMLPKHLLEQLPGGFSYIGMNWTGIFPNDISPGLPIVGTGPWMGTSSIMSEWTAGDHITLVRNPNYHWKTDKPGAPDIQVDELIMNFFQDSTSMVLALENKELDVAAFPPTAYDAIKDDVISGSVKNITTFDGPKITQYWTEIAFCMNEGGGSNPSRLDPVVRQALHMATNKQYIVNNMYLGYAEVGTTLIPPINSYWHYEPTASERFDYNLTAAANLLEANGYIDVDSDGIRECTISSAAVQMGWVDEGTKLVYQMLVRKEYPEEKDIAQYLKNQWEQVGVLVQYLVVEELTLSQIAYSYNYDTLIWYWSADVDPNYQLFVVTKGAWAGWSDCKYYNPAYDENYSKSVSTLDWTERKTYVENCQKIFYNDSAYIILAYADQTNAWRDDNLVGWGDWAADPGRSVDNFWMGSPLWFDLRDANPSNTITPGGNGIDPMMIALGVAVAAVVVIAVVYLVMKGKKKGGGLREEPESPLGD